MRRWQVVLLLHRDGALHTVGVLSRHWTYSSACQHATHKRRMAANPKAVYQVRRRRWWG